MDKDYIKYVLEGSFSLERLTSKNIKKYSKIIELLSNYKKEFLTFSTNIQDAIIQYILSKLDKRYKFKVDYVENEELLILLKLYRDIEFKGATSLEITNIINEFRYMKLLNIQFEEMKNERMINIESRANLNQIRFK